MKSVISILAVLFATLALSGCLTSDKDDAQTPAEQAPMNQEMPTEEAPLDSDMGSDMPMDDEPMEGDPNEGVGE